jgi:glycosyltransferase involved in cell wall biosynthesis
VRVLYLTQVFETEGDPGSERHLFLCRYLAGRGHSVTAVTSNVDYKRTVAKFPGSGWRVRKRLDGVEVSYVYSYPHFRGSLLKRVAYFLTYMCATLVEGLTIRGVDLVYAVSTPLTVGLLGYMLSRMHRCPFFFEVTDVWPDAAVAVGVVRNRVLIKAAGILERFCYRKAARIVALTEGIRENIVDKGVPRGKVHLATNGVDKELFQEGPGLERDAQSLLEELGFVNSFVCMYLGAHGRYNALETIIDAAEVLRGNRQFVFVLVGDGDEKVKLEGAVRSRGLENVRFLPSIVRSKAAVLLRCADLLLLPNRKGRFFTMNLPNKLFDFLASARPIIVAGEGESADVVRRAGAGLVVAAEDGQAMAEAVLSIAGLEGWKREAMGRSGREYVLARYDRSAICQDLAVMLEARL